MTKNVRDMTTEEQELLAASLVGAVFRRAEPWRGRQLFKKVVKWRRVNQPRPNRLVYVSIQVKMQPCDEHGNTYSQGEYWSLPFLYNIAPYVQVKDAKR